MVTDIHTQHMPSACDGVKGESNIEVGDAEADAVAAGGTSGRRVVTCRGHELEAVHVAGVNPGGGIDIAADVLDQVGEAPDDSGLVLAEVTDGLTVLRRFDQQPPEAAPEGRVRCRGREKIFNLAIVPAELYREGIVDAFAAAPRPIGIH